MRKVLLEVKNVKKYFPIHGGVFYRKIADVQALDGVSFSVDRGDTIGIVGESGCGKSTLGKTVLRLHQPDCGQAIFEGKDVFVMDSKEILEIRRDMQMIFQDPFSSLNSRMTVGDIIREPLDNFKIGTKAERKRRVAEVIDIVGMRKNVLNRYPHEFSGGQRQRIGIARAVVVRPKLIVADEPVSALDVSIQSQILNLLTDLQKEFNLTFLFIAHDLSVVEYVSDTIAVMYLGRIVEITEKELLFKQPRHPYTISLLSAIPIPDPTKKRKKQILVGDVPSPINPPSGCRFHTRCPVAQNICSQKDPSLKTAAGSSGDRHLVACHFEQNSV